jgi:uncharacterized protein YbjT (DUF2867 family)
MVRRPLAPETLGADEVVVADALDPPSLAAAVEGVRAVFSCLGASVQPALGHGRASYGDVDTPANCNLIAAASREKVTRFAYVSVAGAASMMHLDYVRAHERVVEALRASGLAYAVVRPTGFFSMLEEAFLPFAARGSVPYFGDLDQRSNPIHDDDLAAVCADAVARDDFGEREVGGPEVLSRREVIEAAFAAVGKPPRLRRVPTAMVRAMSTLATPFHPRIAHILRFFVHVMTHDAIAPAHGTRRIADYFVERARVTTPR